MSEDLNQNIDQLFSPDTEIEDPKSKNDVEFKPKAEKGQNNVYQAILRFVPWWKNPKKGSIIDKWVSYLIDPVTDKGRFVDCPTSVGKDSPLLDMYRRLKKSESVQEQKKADIFKRRHTYATLVQVLKDPNEPENEGKIMVWRFGIKIYEKITSELKPVIGESHDPFDLINGKAFELKITKVAGFNNYDQSKFLDKRIPLCIPDSNGKLIPINKDSNKKEVFEWVKKNSPDLDKYGYTEWDQETLEYVNHVINSVTGQANMANNYSSIVNEVKKSGGNIDSQSQSQSQSQEQSQSQSQEQTQSEVSTEDISIEDDDSIGNDNIDDNIGELPSVDDEDISNNNDGGNEGIGGDLDDIMKNA